MATSTMLVINVHDQPAPLPAALEARLSGSPTKTPDELAEICSRASSAASRLRAAHLDAVRDRAARESQRAADAAARKLRAQARRVEAVQRKLFAAETKTVAKKEASEAERDARKLKREEMAASVAEARRLAGETRQARAAALSAAEKKAALQVAKNIQSVVDKSAYQVKHAIAVAAAQKEKERAEAAAAGEKLTIRLDAAADRRQSLPGSPTSSTAASSFGGASSSAVRHRVLNDEKVASQMRRKLYEANLDKAVSKRAAILESVARKAGAENARAASVAASAAAKEQGTDDKTAAIKQAMFEKLMNAEVARLTALKQRATTGAAKHADTTSVIIVHVDKTPVMPPPELLLRLSNVPKHLVATADARQSGAAARRARLAATAMAQATRANEKRAAALARIGKAHAALEAAVSAKAARALATLGLAQGKASFLVAKEGRRAANAESRRATAAAATAAKGAADAKAAADAAERRGAKLRAIAKAGIVAVRAAKTQTRRNAAAAEVAARGEKKVARCAAATAARAAHLASRVAIAQKRMKAMHPKREVADMEIKTAA